MTQNPYAQQTPVFTGAPLPDEPRTSVMAILSLISGILALVGCCVLGVPLGVLAFLLGAPALISISKSQGRLSGTGLAVGGIVTGLIGLILQIAMIVGISSGVGMLKVYDKAFTGVQGGDATVLQSVMTPGTMGKLNDATLAAFKDSYAADLGAFVATRPTSITKIVAPYGELDDAKRLDEVMRLAAGGPPIVLKAEFEKGDGIVVFVFPNNPQGNQTYPLGPVENLGVFAPTTGKLTWLIPPSSGASGTTSGATGAATKDKGPGN